MLELLNLFLAMINSYNFFISKSVELRLGPNTFDGFPDAGITEVIPDSLGNLVNLGKLCITWHKLDPFYNYCSQINAFTFSRNP